MNITEYADAINVEIVLRYYPNQNGRWMAEFDDTYVMENGCLRGSFGNGRSPHGAMMAYADEIRGKRIAINSGKPRRREFVVPVTLGGA
jgi:hypothetical protein